MSTAARHAGRVTREGSLRLRDLPAWLRAIGRQKGREVWLEIHRVTGRATQDQHGYYRSTVLPLAADEWGWGDPAELHYRLKEKHLPAIVPVEEWPRRRVGAEETVEPPSSADLTVEQFSAFLQAVIDQMTEAGIAVPPPRGSAS